MKINEIFYSLQGEGRFTGVPAVFVRFAGCNLKCDFCDTDHVAASDMSVCDIVGVVSGFASRHVVLTGGEPALQVVSELTEALHEAGFFIQMETNGTLPLPEGVEIDWITCSAKGRATGSKALRIGHIDEIKLLYHGDEWAALNDIEAVRLGGMERGARVFCLQPLDTGDDGQNELITRQTINYILNHPVWKLSLQTHKMLNVR